MPHFLTSVPPVQQPAAALSKGFALSEAFRRELVRIAFAVAACPVRDRLTVRTGPARPPALLCSVAPPPPRRPITRRNYRDCDCFERSPFSSPQGSEPRLGRPGPRSVSDPALEDAESGPGREGATLVRCILLRAEFGCGGKGKPLLRVRWLDSLSVPASQLLHRLCGSSYLRVGFNCSHASTLSPHRRGMPGDRDMLRDFASAWLWRLSAGGPAPPPLPTSAAAGAAKAAAAGGPAAGGAAAEQPRSPWLRFLWDLHDDLQPQGAPLVLSGASPEPLAPRLLSFAWSDTLPGPSDPAVALGPLQRADVPSTAADFHCCNILDMTMQDQRLGPEDFAALVRAHGCQPGAGAQAALKSCIWMWRSSTNNKRAVRVGSGGGGGGGGVGAAASGYESGDDGDGHEQQGALWEAWKVIEPVVQMAAQRYVASTLASIGVTR